MVRPTRRRVVVAAVAVASLAAAGAVTLPAFAEGSGTITGHFTDNGTPITGTWVNLYSADVVTVTDGAVTAVEEQKLATGAISGTVTYSDGTAAADIQVNASPDEGGISAGAVTDAQGRYTLPYLLPGDYRLSFRRSWNDPPQYAHGVLSPTAAARITVTANATATVDEQLLDLGTLTGLLTTSEGAPVPFASVVATRVGDPDAQTWGSTDASGRYTLTLIVGEYTLRYSTPFGTQWATGRSSESQADPVTIVAEPINEHNEVLAATGSVAFTAVDDTTGAAVPAFCVSTDAGGYCTESGSLSINLLPGSYSLYYYDPTSTYLSGDAPSVEVTSGATTSVVLRMTRGATVTATLVDRQTGAPVENACLELVDVTRPSTLGIESNWCSDATGTVSVPMRHPGTYKAFVWARDGDHGHQWVGHPRGVGEFQRARSITLGAGQTLDLASIKLDPMGGDITGSFTDETTGAAVPYGVVSLSSYSFGYGGQDGMVAVEDGHYTVSGLGPYDWALYLSAPGYASEWSGDRPTRTQARPVTVRPNAPTVYDVQLGLGTTVSGHITDGDGTAPIWARITFYNAMTQDEIAVDDLYDADVAGHYTTQISGVQRVKAHYIAQFADGYHEGWAGGADFDSADAFVIRPHGSQTIDIRAV